MRLEGLGRLKNPMTSSGIEPGTSLNDKSEKIWKETTVA
jgi:hypothetical protein